MKSTCGACRLVFSSVSSFDMHRVGKYEPLERRCLSPEEMKIKGMAQNDRGWWTTGDFDASGFHKSSVVEVCLCNALREARNGSHFSLVIRRARCKQRHSSPIRPAGNSIVEESGHPQLHTAYPLTLLGCI